MPYVTAGSCTVQRTTLKSASRRITVHSVSGTVGCQPQTCFSMLHINWGGPARYICFTFRPQNVPNSRSTNVIDDRPKAFKVTPCMITQRCNFKILNNSGSSQRGWKFVPQFRVGTYCGAAVFNCTAHSKRSRILHQWYFDFFFRSQIYQL